MARDLELDRRGFHARRERRAVLGGRGHRASRGRCSARSSGSAFIEVTRRRLGHEHDHLHLGVLRGADARAGAADRQRDDRALVHRRRRRRRLVRRTARRSARSSPRRSPCTTSPRASRSASCSSRAASPRGARAGWSVFTSLPQPLMAVPAFLFVECVRAACSRPASASPAARWSGWSRSSWCPEAREDLSDRFVAAAVAVSMAVMVAFQVLVLA